MLGSSIVRASSSASFIATSGTRRAIISSKAAPAAYLKQRQQCRQAHAISNPTLANIEKRWEEMPPQEQADLWMQLRDRMKVDWKEMTLQEKKAAYWIAFGPHGPRTPAPPGEGWKIFGYTMVGVAASGVVFYITRQFARDPPRTMTAEWQEASEEYMQEHKMEPISGYKGMLVQSKRSGKSPEEHEAEQE